MNSPCNADYKYMKEIRFRPFWAVFDFLSASDELVLPCLPAGKEDDDDQDTHADKRRVPVPRPVKEPAAKQRAKRAKAITKRLHHAREARCALSRARS